MVNATELYPNTPTPDLDVSDWDFDPGYNLNTTLNPASIVCGSIVCSILLAIRAYDKSLVDRVSLRLTAVVSAVDVIKAAVYIIFTYIVTPGAACSTTAWLVLFLTNLYTFLSVAIAFNLQWIFLHKNQIHRHLEAAYFSVSITLAFITTIPPLAAGRLGYDPFYGSCWFRSYSSKTTIAWEWGTFLSWNLLGSIYCFFVVVAVILRLRQNVSILGAYTSSKASPDATSQEKSKKTLRLLRKLVVRISMYALIPIITQGGWYISEIILQFQHRLDIGITYWVISGTDLPGVLNLIAFCMDPAISNALSAVKLAMIDTYGDANSPNAKDHKFKAWITRTFLGSKQLHNDDSLFYRMSESDNMNSSDTVVDIDLQHLPLTHYSATGKSGPSSSRGSTAAINQGSQYYKMPWIGNANEENGTSRYSEGDEEKIRTVLRGL
ncbi:hypothetical protein BC943DRAFT_329642 [Umbelopsis sp. AD052]|nr:hypothetical protein BC943DRAFT_329642 [Umbelopsis sp. AD052]